MDKKTLLKYLLLLLLASCGSNPRNNTCYNTDETECLVECFETNDGGETYCVEHESEYNQREMQFLKEHK